AIIAPRLIRSVCRDCPPEMPASNREKEIFAKRGMEIETIVRGPGCAACNMTGYRGRVAIHEVLIINDEMREVINSHGTPAMLREIAMRNNTVFLIDDGLDKVKRGITTTEEVLRVSLI